MTSDRFLSATLLLSFALLIVVLASPPLVGRAHVGDDLGNLHLLADHLGWFEDGRKTIEDILRDKGEEVKRLNVPIHIDNNNGSTPEIAEPEAKGPKH